MPSALYGTGAYKRTDGNLPTLRLINMYVEKSRTSEQGITLQSRPGLETHATRGTGPINGIFAAEGTSGGEIFVISNQTFYKTATNLGTVNGTGNAKIVSSGTELVLTRGSDAFSYNGVNLSGIVNPWTGAVSSVTFIGGLFIFLQAGSAKFYWSAPLDGRTIDALDFATAEQAGDELLECEALSDNLWLFGQYTTEIWQHTGDADLPFTRMQQVTYDKGILNAGYSARLDNTIYWVGHDYTVYRVGDGAPERVSDHWLEKRIEEVGIGGSAYPMFLDGHWFFVVRLVGESYAFDAATGEWFELQTDGGQFSGKCGVFLKGTGMLFGNDADGTVMTFGGWDDQGVELERLFTFAVQLDEPLSIDNVKLWANPGATTDLTADPIIELRMSRDAGEEFDEWEQTSLGQSGEYTSHPEWRALGMFGFPGALGEVRLTDAVPLRVSAVKYNVPGGGRG